MNKIFLIVWLVGIFFLLPESSYGQKNVGEFNRQEDVTLINLQKEAEGLGYSNATGSNASSEGLNQYINKAKKLITKYEERIQKCRDALKNLPEIPAAEIKNNNEYKSWTEGIIGEYESGIKIIRGRIENAERMVNNIKEKPSESKITEKENKTVNSSSAQSNDNFWSDNGNGSTNNKSSGTVSNNNQDQSALESHVSDNNFKRNISHIKEGQYFVDDQGQHYLKTSNGARKVDKLAYERAQANKITAEFQQREAERIRVAEATTYAINTTFTSFYAMRSAGQNLKDAATLDGHFENIEDLNHAFAQKLSEVSQMGEELKAVSINSVQNYAQAVTAANSTSTADYTAFGQALGAFGGIVAGISADKAAKEAREELKAQREAHEKAIKSRELKALRSIREEIGKLFPEGGMPLSNHKINAPVLYLFAYSSNKNEWNDDKVVPMTISNVIPVYQYSDGTYPYISSVKQTFENGGINNPTIIGYFTDLAMAEKYHESLLNAANQGRFLISEVDIKVIPKDTKTIKLSKSDFWGNPIKPNTKDTKKTTTTKKEDNFWNN